MSFLAPLLPFAGMALGGLLGSKQAKANAIQAPAQVSAPQINYTPSGFSGGGLGATFGNNGYTVNPSADRTAAVGGLANTFGLEANALGGLAKQFAPGFSALRASQLAALNNSRSAALGDLRQNLASRRVLGSSFGQDTMARSESQFNQDQSTIIAQTYLQELAATQQITQQQFAAARGQFQTGLTELNLEAGLAADLTSKASSVLGSLAQSQGELDMQTANLNAKNAMDTMQLNAKSAAATGSFFGGLGQLGGQGLSKMFGSSGGGTNLADLGVGSGVGSGGFNFLDAMA